MTPALPPVEPGRYRLALALTYTPDYGIHPPSGGQRQGPRDVVRRLRAGRDPHRGDLFGTIELIEGPHRLTLVVAGKNLASRGFLFGLDCIVLEPR